MVDKPLPNQMKIETRNYWRTKKKAKQNFDENRKKNGLNKTDTRIVENRLKKSLLVATQVAKNYKWECTQWPVTHSNYLSLKSLGWLKNVFGIDLIYL